MIRFTKRLVLLVSTFVAFAFSAGAQAQTFYSYDGPWTDWGTWNLNSGDKFLNDEHLVPGVNTTNGVDIVVSAGTIVTFDCTSDVSVNSLRVDGTLKILGAKNLLVANPVTGSGVISLSTLDKLKVSGNPISEYGGVLELSSDANIEVPAGKTYTFGSMEVKSATTSVKGPGVLKITNSLKVKGGALKFADGANGVIQVGGDMSIESSAIVSSSASKTYEGVLQIAGSLINRGTIDFTDSSKAVKSPNDEKTKKVDLEFVGNTDAEFLNYGTAKLFRLRAKKVDGHKIHVTNVNRGTISTSSNYVGETDYRNLPWSVLPGSELSLGDGIRIENWAVPNDGSKELWNHEIVDYVKFGTKGCSMYIPSGATLTIAGAEVNACLDSEEHPSHVFIAGTLNVTSGILRLPQYSFGIYFTPALAGEPQVGVSQLHIEGTQTTSQIYTSRICAYVDGLSARDEQNVHKGKFTPAVLNAEGGLISFTVQGRLSGGYTVMNSHLALFGGSQFSMSNSALFEFSGVQYPASNSGIAGEGTNGIFFADVAGKSSENKYIYEPISYNVTGGTITIGKVSSDASVITDFRIYGADNMVFNNFNVSYATVKFMAPSDGRPHTDDKVQIAALSITQRSNVSFNIKNLYVQTKLNVSLSTISEVPENLYWVGNNNGTSSNPPLSNDVNNAVVWKNVYVQKPSNRYVQVTPHRSYSESKFRFSKNLVVESGSLKGEVVLCGSEAQTISASEPNQTSEVDMILANTTPSYSSDYGVMLASNLKLNSVKFNNAIRFNLQDYCLELNTYPDKGSTTWSVTNMFYTDNSRAAGGLMVPVPSTTGSYIIPVGVKSGSDFFYSYVKPLYTTGESDKSISVVPVQGEHPDLGGNVFLYTWRINTNLKSVASDDAYECYVVNTNKKVVKDGLADRLSSAYPVALVDDSYGMHYVGPQNSDLSDGIFPWSTGKSSYTITFSIDRCNSNQEAGCKKKNNGHLYLSGDFTLARDGLFKRSDKGSTWYVAPGTTGTPEWSDKIWKHEGDNATHRGTDIGESDCAQIPAGYTVKISSPYSNKYFHAGKVEVDGTLIIDQRYSTQSWGQTYWHNQLGSINIKEYSGSGVLQYNITDANGPHYTTSDYKTFCSNNESTVEFNLGVDISRFQWSLDYFPNLVITSNSTTKRKFGWFVANGHTYGNFTVGSNVIAHTFNDNAGTLTIDGKIVVESGGTYRIVADKQKSEWTNQLYVHHFVGGIQNDGTIELGNLSAKDNSPKPETEVYVYGDIENNSVINWAGIKSFFIKERLQRLFGTAVKGSTNLGAMYLDKLEVGNMIDNELPLGNTAGVQPINILKGSFRHSLDNSAIGQLSYSGSADFEIPVGCAFTVNAPNANVALQVASQSSNKVKLEGQLLVSSLAKGASLSVKDRTGKYAGIGYADKSTLSLADNSGSVSLSYLAPYSGGDAAITLALNKNTVINFEEGTVPNVCGVFDIRPGSSSTLRAATINVKNASLVVPAVNYLPATSVSTVSTKMNISSHNVKDSKGVMIPVTINSEPDFCSIIVESGAKTKLVANPLTIGGSLTVIGSGLFDCGNYDLTLSRDLTVDQATGFVCGNNTVKFVDPSVSKQSIVFDGKIEFNNLYSQTAKLYAPTNGMLVRGNLEVNSGVLVLDKNSTVANVLGSVNIATGAVVRGVGRVLMSNSAASQVLQCRGEISNLEIDNTNNVVASVPQTEPIKISSSLVMTNGNLEIGANMLEFSERAELQGDAFGPDKMIATNGTSTDRGIRVNIRKGDNVKTYLPVIPIGKASDTNKYTPISVVSLKATTGGFVTFNCNDGACESYAVIPENIDHILGYYWTVKASESLVVDSDGELDFFAYKDDAKGYDAENYVTALLEDHSGKTRKPCGPAEIDGSYLKLNFSVSGNHSGLCGIYTCGHDQYLPNNVYVYISVKDGMWDDPTVWREYNMQTGVKGAAPSVVNMRGCGVIIDNSVSLDNTSNRYMYINFLQLRDNGILDLNMTKGNSFGNVSGRGRMIVHSNAMPGGNYEEFYSENGGTVEYTGDENSDYNTFTKSTYHNNVVFSGSGRRTITRDYEVTAWGNVTIEGDVVVEMQNNDFKLYKDLILDGGSNTGSGCFIFSGTDEQNLVFGPGIDTYSLAGLGVDNSRGVTVSKNLTVGKLVLNRGVITCGDNDIYIPGANPVVTNKDKGSFVDGYIKLDLLGGKATTFYVGADDRNANINVTPNKNGIWRVRYFNNQHPQAAAAQTALTSLNVNYIGNEYWVVEGPDAVAQARVKLRWDEYSGGFSSNSSCVISYGKVVDDEGERDIWQTIGYSGATPNTSSGTLTTQYAITKTVDNSNGRVYCFGIGGELLGYRWIGTLSSEWDESQNWSSGVVPSAGADVVVPRAPRYPVINDGQVNINSIEIQSGAKLTLEGAATTLTVVGNVNLPSDAQLILHYDVDENPNLVLRSKDAIIGGGNVTVKRTINSQRIYYFGSAVMDGNIQEPNYAECGWDYTNLYMKKYDHVEFNFVANGSKAFAMSGNGTIAESMNTFGIVRVSTSTHQIPNGKYTFTQVGKVATASPEETFKVKAYHGPSWYSNPYPFALSLVKGAISAEKGIEPTIYARTMDGSWEYLEYNTSTRVSVPREFKSLAPFQGFEVYCNDRNMYVDESTESKTTIDIKPDPFTTQNVMQKSAVIGMDSDEELEKKVLRLNVGTYPYVDELAILFDSTGDFIMGSGDSPKKENPSPKLLSQISTSKGVTPLVISHFPDIETLANENINIPISLSKATNESELVIWFSNINEFAYAGDVYLVDNLMGTRTNLSVHQEYNCPNVDNLYDGRFELSFVNAVSNQGDNLPTLVENVTTSSRIVIGTTEGNEASVTVYGTIHSGAKAIVYDILGRVMEQIDINSRTTLVNIPSNGIYLVKVINGDEHKSSKIVL